MPDNDDPNADWNASKASFDHGFQSRLLGVPIEQVPDGHNPYDWKSGWGAADYQMNKSMGRKGGGRISGKKARPRLDRRKR